MHLGGGNGTSDGGPHQIWTKMDNSIKSCALFDSGPEGENIIFLAPHGEAALVFLVSTSIRHQF